MRLRLSNFIHLLPVGHDRILVVDAISHVRLVVNREVASVLSRFAQPTEVPASSLSEGLLAALMQRGILTEKSPQDETQHVAGVLAPYHGRDPSELLERFRRAAREGSAPYFAVTSALEADDLTPCKHAIDLLLFGDCDVQMEADFLRADARRRGVDLRVAASFPDDIRLVGEHKHDAVVIGALRARYTITYSTQPVPHQVFIDEARKMLDGVRQLTSKPILIDNLPEPTTRPLGIADGGPRGHRNRFRSANIALEELAATYADVYVVDIAAALNAKGAERLLDDGLIHFSHFGSPGWLLQRPEEEKKAVHDAFPDMGGLAAFVEGNPYLREEVAARIHMDVLISCLGLDGKKCVIVDLDGLLWPGVLAETGTPFRWSEEVSGPFSYIGLYFGLHEALWSLKRRGILLACVSKNDEATVRELWKYGPQYSSIRVLTPDDFVALRINWSDKVENILSLAEELGLPLESFIFVDDNVTERERVRCRLPEVEVWGDDLIGLRRRLLDDPRLQRPKVTAESSARTELTRAQIDRHKARSESAGEEEFIKSLALEVRVERLAGGDAVERVRELFQRTTQFNTTGAKFSSAELRGMLEEADSRIFVAHVRDRFGDHGLVGAAVVRNGEILGFALSCRVLGLGVEHKFLRHVLAEMASERTILRARILETARNMPVRNLYRDNGFHLRDGVWISAWPMDAAPDRAPPTTGLAL